MMKNNFAEELQTSIDQAKAWAEMGNVEKSVDIFIRGLKKDLTTQAKRGVEIDDMKYVVGGHTFDNIYAAFHQACNYPHHPTDRQVKKFKALLGVRMLEEGLKFEFHRDDRTDIVTMRFTVYVNDI